jgi:hypothetical protein
MKTMTHRTTLSTVVPERTSARLTDIFRDDAGHVIGADRFVALQ